MSCNCRFLQSFSDDPVLDGVGEERQAGLESTAAEGSRLRLPEAREIDGEDPVGSRERGEHLEPRRRRVAAPVKQDQRGASAPFDDAEQAKRCLDATRGEGGRERGEDALLDGAWMGREGAHATVISDAARLPESWEAIRTVRDGVPGSRLAKHTLWSRSPGSGTAIHTARDGFPGSGTAIHTVRDGSRRVERCPHGSGTKLAIFSRQSLVKGSDLLL